MDSYFVIFCNPDGETCVIQHTRDELLHRLSTNYYGTRECFDSLPGEHPTDWNLRKPDGTLLIIKGKIVVPAEKEVQPVFEVE